MAMAGCCCKGNNGGGHRERGRPYGLMLLLAVGVALVGVMALLRLRERHIQNVLLKDKDRELFSLHLLLQKEREYTKEMRKEEEEMRAKVYSLRTQKMQVDSRIPEMQSTINLLREEQRMMELALEEKQDEIKLLHEKEMDRGKRDLQDSSLKEILKQKEIEITNLEWQLQSLNVSTRGSELQKEEMSKLEERKESGLLQQPSENSEVSIGAEETERKVDVSDATMLTISEKLLDQQNVTGEGSAQGEAAGEKNGSEGLGMNRGGSTAFQDEQNSADNGERNGLNAISTANGAAREASVVVGRKAKLEQLKDGEKSEQPGISNSHSGSTSPRKLGDSSGSWSRGMMWRTLARDRRLEGNRSSATTRHQRFVEDAIETVAGKQSGNNTSKEQDQNMNTKHRNMPDQIGGTVKVSRNFHRDSWERKEDGHPHGPKEDTHETSNLRHQKNGKIPTIRSLEDEAMNPLSVDENRAVEVEIRGGGSQEGAVADQDDLREADVEDSWESETEGAGHDFSR